MGNLLRKYQHILQNHKFHCNSNKQLVMISGMGILKPNKILVTILTEINDE